jgi:glycogen operon protein
VSYNEKHNDANGEDGRDGADDNRSWNCGVEGETDDPEILELRARQRRNFLATLLLSQGVPMLLHGDELGRSQGGNNNAYCQDNDVSWIDWRLDADEAELMNFTGALTAFRRKHPSFQRRRFFEGKPMRRTDALHDIAWFTPAGEEMTEQNWGDDFGRSVAVFLNGDAIADRDPRGERIYDDSFVMAFNAYHEPIGFTLPEEEYGTRWKVVVDTAAGAVEPRDGLELAAGEELNVTGRALTVLQRVAR